jgi:predicted aspartyl protease
MTIPLPLVELWKIPEQMEKVRNFLLGDCVVERENEDPPIFLQTMRLDPSGRPLFYVTLEVEGLFLRNCMINTGAASNVMPLKITERLGIKVIHPYNNVCLFY